MSTKAGSVTIPPGGGSSVEIGGLGIVWKIDGAQADDRFSVVHHPLAPRSPAIPPRAPRSTPDPILPHRHCRFSDT